MNASNPVSRIAVPIALAAIAVAIVLGATLHHGSSHAHEAGAMAAVPAGTAAGGAAFVDVSLPAASEVFAHRAAGTDDDCPTF